MLTSQGSGVDPVWSTVGGGINTATFIIYNDSGTYKAISGTDGSLVASNANFETLMEQFTNGTLAHTVYAVAGATISLEDTSQSGTTTTDGSPVNCTDTNYSCLINSGATFVTTGVKVGTRVFNNTDNTFAYVTAVVSETELKIDTDIFDVSEAYIIPDVIYDTVGGFGGFNVNEPIVLEKGLSTNIFPACRPYHVWGITANTISLNIQEDVIDATTAQLGQIPYVSQGGAEIHLKKGVYANLTSSAVDINIRRSFISIYGEGMGNTILKGWNVAGGAHQTAIRDLTLDGERTKGGEISIVGGYSSMRTTTAGSSGNTLIDSSADFINRQIKPGDPIGDFSSSLATLVKSVDSATQLTTEGAATWSNGETYYLHHYSDYYPTNFTVERVEILNPHMDAITCHRARHITVRDNVIKFPNNPEATGDATSGLEIEDGCEDALYENNAVYNASVCIFPHTHPTSYPAIANINIKDNKCFFNTFSGVGDTGGGISIDGAATAPILNLTLENNLVDAGGRSNVYVAATEKSGIGRVHIRNNRFMYLSPTATGSIQVNDNGTSGTEFVIEGNRCYGCLRQSINVMADNAIIKGNYLYSPAGEGINLSSGADYGIIIGNIIYGDTSSCLNTDADYGIISGNRFNGCAYDIQLGTSANDNKVFDNILTNASKNIWVRNAANDIKNNTGFVTRNIGTADVDCGATVTHGIVGTPTYIQITAGDTGITSGIYPSAIGATTFIITCTDSGDGTYNFSWEAGWVGTN